MSMRWYGKGAEFAIRTELAHRINAAGKFLRDQIRIALSIPNTVEINKWRARQYRRNRKRSLAALEKAHEGIRREADGE